MQRWLIAGLLLLGAGLRVHGLADHGLWIDEYGTWWTIAGGGLRETSARALDVQGQSPLYYSFVWAWTQLVGVSVASLRFPSLVCGLALLALAYPLGLRMFGDRRFALLTLAAVAINERLIFYAQDARPYALALLCSTASMLFHARAVSEGRSRDRVLAAVLMTLAWYAHYFFGVLSIVQLLHLWVHRERVAPQWRAWCASFAGMGVAMAPGLFQLRALFARRSTLEWVAGEPERFVGLEFAGELLDPLVLLVAAAALLAAWLLGRLSELPARTELGLIALWFGIPTLVFGLLPPWLGLELSHSRYLAMAIPAVPLLHALLIALASARRGSRSWRVGVPLCFVSIVLIARIVPMVERSGGPFWWFHNHRWQEAVESVVADYRDGDVILYRTGFIELDEMVMGRASAWTGEFARWPIEVHLPATREFELQPLAYSENPEVLARLEGQLAERARGARRFWVIGLDPLDTTSTNFEALLGMSRLGHDLRLVEARNHRLVEVLLLQRTRKEQR